MNLPSQVLEDAVNAMASLPGIGKKTALRLVLHLLKAEDRSTFQITEALTSLKQKIVYCVECNNISEKELCTICTSSYRDDSIICVVEDLRDVIAIENTGQYSGKFHVLGGVISPMEGVSPNDLSIDKLVSRCLSVKELIFALPSTMEGDTTAFYIQKQLKNSEVKVSTLARGIPIGGELEYADEVTLGRSILERKTYHTS